MSKTKDSLNNYISTFPYCGTIAFNKGKATVQWDVKRTNPILHPKNFKIEFISLQLTEMKNTTFGQFWKWLTRQSANVAFLNRVFYGALYGRDLRDWVKESKLKPDKNPIPLTEIEDHKMDFLSVNWSSEDTIYRKNQSAIIYPEFHGESNKGGMGFGVEFSTLNNLMRYPLKIDRSLKIRNEDLDAEHRIPNEPPKLETNLGMTLYDVINGILFEISWHRAKTK